MAAPRKRVKPAKPRTAYHHGNLRAALVEAALKIVTEKGPEGVSVREAARRAGVSPAAPFRHFPDRAALLIAVAEEAMSHFVAEIQRAESDLPADADPVQRFRAIGIAYIRFALRHPAHFKAMTECGPGASPVLEEAGNAIRGRMESLIAEGQRTGVMIAGDPALLRLTAYAHTYGLARLAVDGMFSGAGPETIPEEQLEQVFAASLDLLGTGLYARVQPYEETPERIGR